jgi:non-canonical (house-cleaning) NTP pyrophosphatase
MLVVLGSKRGPKLRALEAVLRELGGEFGSAEIQAHETESGVRETPLQRAEIMRGAWNRVQAVRALVHGGDFWVGMEGGLHIADCGVRIADFQQTVESNPQSEIRPPPRTQFAWLENWACVSDGKRTYCGCGGSIPLPEAIIREVVERGRSLAEVIDQLSGKQDVRSSEGTWGILTGGRVTREAVFQRALLNAFAPFYSPIDYGWRGWGGI